MMRSMVRFLATLIALFIAGPAEAAERRYAVADFERIAVEGPYRVRLVVGGPSSAVASGSAQAIDAVSVDVQSGTLRVRRNGGAWGSAQGRPPEPATITLVTRNLRSARVVGAGSLEISGGRGLRIDLSVEGPGRLAATGIQADNLSVGLRGSGAMVLTGSAKALTADVQGSGSLDAAALDADAITLLAATAGEISLTARRSATVTANGLGSVTVAGSPACTLRGPGAAEVRCGRER